MSGTVAQIEAGIVKLKMHASDGYPLTPRESGDLAKAIADLLAAPRGEAAGWLPIETAPKDGTPILAATNFQGQTVVCRWRRHGEHNAERGTWASVPGNYQMCPKLWQPITPPALSGLPVAPAGREEA